MNTTTKQKYQNIAKRISDKIGEYYIRERIKNAFINTLRRAGTKNSFRVFKGGIRFWITGQYFKVRQEQGKEIAIKRKQELEAILEELVKKIDDETAEWESFNKRFNTNIKNKKFSYKNRKLNNTDIEKLFAAAKTDRQKTLLAVIILSGCRAGEIKNLEIGRTKDGKVAFAIKRIKEKKNQQDKNKKTIIKYDMNNFKNFLTRVGVRKINLSEVQNISQRQLEREMQKISKKAGYRKTITIHHIRNFFSSEMKKQFDKIDVAKALGHSWVCTQSSYGHRKSNDLIIPVPEVNANWNVKTKKLELINFDYKEFKEQFLLKENYEIQI